MRESMSFVRRVRYCIPLYPEFNFNPYLALFMAIKGCIVHLTRIIYGKIHSVYTLKVKPTAFRFSEQHDEHRKHV